MQVPPISHNIGEFNSVQIKKTENFAESKNLSNLKKFLILVTSLAIAALAGAHYGIAIASPILVTVCLFTTTLGAIIGIALLAKIYIAKKKLTPQEAVKPSVTAIKFPEVKDVPEGGFFVEVLNASGYTLNGSNISIPPAGMPIKFARGDKTVEEELRAIREKIQLDDSASTEQVFKDQSTEEAIHCREGNFAKIALNFANEHHAGGGPGFHKDPTTGSFVYDSPSAKAQEESICQRSNLFASLTQLPHEIKKDNMCRSYYKDTFDSRIMAYCSDNHLFAVQNPKGFYDSTYLDRPQAVSFITSAATCYVGQAIDCSKDSIAYNDATQRIETHLLSAAHKAAVLKTSNPDQPVELILGAFGCGAFVPRVNPDEYRVMIATIYKELLPQYNGIFDRVTFAVPTFGAKDTNPAFINHKIFKSVLDVN